MSDIRENEYIDTQILALRSKYHEIQSENQPVGNEIQIGTDRAALYKADLFGGACSIMLPETMTDRGAADREVIYQNRNRPQIIKADRERGAAITFSMLPQTGGEEQRQVSEQMAVIRSDMKKIWKQNVFYDTGEVMAENTPVAWMDFKAYCLDGNLYSLLFMFQTQAQTVLGNFHCSFPIYDIWKPLVLKLLTTIQAESTSIQIKSPEYSDGSR
mgnify:FL=1